MLSTHFTFLGETQIQPSPPGGDFSPATGNVAAVMATTEAAASVSGASLPQLLCQEFLLQL
jgi:hypothetical protein